MASTDVAIVILYFTGILTVGALLSSGQKSLREYFLGGRNVPWWAVTCSGIATIVSAVSYIGAPGVAFAGDYTLHQYRLGLPIAILVLCGVMLPFFHYRQRFSIYEYFEERFDLKTRLFTSALFVLLKVCYLALVIYAPALIIKQMFGASIWQIVFFVGLITTAYTMLGGIKAVIWIDALQLLILLGGLAVVVAVALGKIDGGLGQVFEIGREHDKFRFFDFSWDVTVRYTFWGGLIGGSFYLVTQFGADQAELQRFMAARSLRQANIALIATLVMTFAFGVFVFFVGTTLFVFYTAHPGKGAFEITSNSVLPKFIIEELPLGMKGVLVASILSAAMSTVSSVLNSLTTVSIADFYNRFKPRESSVRRARVVTFGFGAIGCLLGGFAGALGNVLETAMMLNSLFGGPLVGAFLLGMLNKRAHGNAAFVALICGLGFALYLGLLTNVSFLWHSAFSATATFIVGWLLSFLQAAKPATTNLPA